MKTLMKELAKFPITPSMLNLRVVVGNVPLEVVTETTGRTPDGKVMTFNPSAIQRVEATELANELLEALEAENETLKNRNNTLEAENVKLRDMIPKSGPE